MTFFSNKNREDAIDKALTAKNLDRREFSKIPQIEAQAMCSPIAELATEILNDLDPDAEEIEELEVRFVWEAGNRY